MLLLDSPDLTVADGRSVQLGDLPRFNGDDPAFRVTGFDGWFDTPVPDAVYVANGGGPGVVPSGPWLPKEMVYQLTGHMYADRAVLPVLRRMLLAALPTDRDVPVVCYGNGADVDLQVFVRRYDRADVNLGVVRIDFSVPLLAADPYKYPLLPLVGQMGVFAGQTWYRVYVDGTPWARSYTAGSRVYQQSIVASAYPESLSLDSGGDAASQRVEFVVTGPLVSGEWWLYHETTGRRMWGAFGLTSQQSVVIDCRTKTATLNGSDVSHLIYGDWLTLEPGRNTYQLVGGTASGAYASVTALEAHL